MFHNVNKGCSEVGGSLFSQVTGQEEMALNCSKGSLNWKIGKIPSQKGFSNTARGHPAKWWCHHPWRNLKDGKKWHLETVHQWPWQFWVHGLT